MTRKLEFDLVIDLQPLDLERELAPELDLEWRLFAVRVQAENRARNDR